LTSTVLQVQQFFSSFLLSAADFLLFARFRNLSCRFQQEVDSVFEGIMEGSQLSYYRVTFKDNANVQFTNALHINEANLKIQQKDWLESIDLYLELLDGQFRLQACSYSTVINRTESPDGIAPPLAPPFFQFPVGRQLPTNLTGDHDKPNHVSISPNLTTNATKEAFFICIARFCASLDDHPFP